MNYSKKQIQPLIEKFKINAETNAVFNRIIAMFNGQTNYQIWAIKAVFGKQLSIENLETIHAWAENNQTLIKDLIKKNIVSYTTAIDFKNLLQEMRGLDMLAFVKATVNKFNTAQREMLRGAIFNQPMNGFEATQNPSFTRWFGLLKQFETLAEHRKRKFISTSSAFTNLSDLKRAIKDSLTATYDWNKEDLLSYIQRQTPDCEVVFNEGNVVVVNVPSFESSKKLGGNGRTSWCLTREDRYFNQYVTEHKGNKQYFLFNFSKKERDELAYLGFTVNTDRGICNAHSTKNNNMLGDGISYNGTTVNIHKALQMSGVNLGCFLRLKNLKRFTWSVEAVLHFIEAHPNHFAIVSNVDNRLIVRALTNEGLGFLIEHTLIDGRNFSLSNQENKAYVLLDFNLKCNDDKSIVVMGYVKDAYKMDTLNKMFDAYAINITKDGYLASIGLSAESFLNREAINPTILLHKLIDEKAEADAIALIEKQGDDFDVNFEFNQRTPIFSAINNKFYKLFTVIVNHKKFDCTTHDGFGETLLQSLLYTYRTEPGTKESKDETALKNMITIILDSPNFDFNVQNINLDTAINIACERPELNWVVAKLLEKPNVNLNIVNDFNCAALGNAIRYQNIEAIKMLGKRPDLVVREEDKELALKHGINLDSYINPIPFAEGSKTVVNDATTQTSTTAPEYAEVFAKAFAHKR